MKKVALFLLCICLLSSPSSSIGSYTPNPMTTSGDTVYGGTSGVPTRLPIGSTNQVLTVVSGLPAWSSASSFSNPMTTLGDIIYENSTPAPARLAGNTTSTKNYLTQTGNGSISAVPAWGTIAAGDLPTITLTGDVTGAASGGSIATTAAATQANIVTLSKSTGVATHGTNTNDNASSGYVGEYISGNPGSGVSVGSSNNFKTITSISLTAGDWDVVGLCGFTAGSATVTTLLQCCVTTSNNSCDATNSGGFSEFNTSSSAGWEVPTPPRRFSLSAGSTTVYVTGAIGYTTAGTATWNTDSFIQARRMR